MKCVWSILLCLLFIDASMAIKELIEHLHNKPRIFDIIPKPKLPGISIQVGHGSFGFGFGFGENKPPKGNDHGKPDYPGTWTEKDKESHRPNWGDDKYDRPKPGPHGHDRYPEPHPHDNDRYPKPHPHEHDGHVKPGSHGHDRYPKPHPHDQDRYPKPHPHEHDRYPKPGSDDYGGYQKPGSYDHDKYPDPDETFDDKKEYPKHEKDYPKPGHNKEYPKREDKDSALDWENIGESNGKSESLMDSDLVGDDLINPRNKRNKRHIESRIYHVPLMFRSNGLPFKVKIENGRRNMLR